jgi:hypothetical protein
MIASMTRITIETVDLDRDGHDEIVTGSRGKPYGVYTYRLEGASGLVKFSIGAVSAAGYAVADLDGGGKPEIACIGQAMHNVSLWDMTP